MTLEDRLQSHLDDAARRLPTPGDRLDDVVARGRRRRRVERAAVALALVAIAVAVPASIAALRVPTVDFAEEDPPEPQPVQPTPTPTPEPDVVPTPPPNPGPSPDPEVTPTPADPEEPVLSGSAVLADLGARVLAHGPYEHDPVLLVEPAVGDRPSQTHTVDPRVADVVLPDGRNGVVLQRGSQPTIVWYPDAHGDRTVELVSGEEGDETHRLRAIDPDGRAVYSVAPPADEPGTEDAVERFYAVTLAQGAEPELLGERSAFESWHVGPAWSASGPVHASCHLMCTLQPGLVTSEGDELYRNDTAIEGLTATPDGRIVAFVEGGPAGERMAELVLLDGESFAELARVPLLPDGSEMGHATVSLSADGQRVLVGLGSVGPAPLPPTPVQAYLVEDAMGEDPTVMLVEFEGAVRWFDPSAAVASGGETTVEDRALVERLIAFAADPSADALDAVPFAAEIRLGLGSTLLETVDREALVDPDRWRLDGMGEPPSWRAYVGPFSALELLADAGEYEVAVGPHPHCASPPVPAPDAVSGLRRVSVQPIEVDSCLDWWTVDAFVDADGRVVAITLDLYEP